MKTGNSEIGSSHSLIQFRFPEFSLEEIGFVQRRCLEIRTGKVCTVEVGFVESIQAAGLDPSTGTKTSIEDGQPILVAANQSAGQAGAYGIFVLPVDAPDNFAIQMSVAGGEQNNRCQLFFRGFDNGHYVLGFSKGQIYVQNKSGNVYADLEVVDKDIGWDSFDYILIANGDRYTVYLDGSPISLFSFTNSEHTGAEMNLGAFNEQSTNVGPGCTFSNVVLWKANP